MGTVYKSFEVHAKKKKRLCCCGVTVRCDSGESSGKKKRRCVEKASICLENTKTHMYRMLIETVDIKGNSDEASEMRRNMLLDH